MLEGKSIGTYKNLSVSGGQKIGIKATDTEKEDLPETGHEKGFVQGHIPKRRSFGHEPQKSFRRTVNNAFIDETFQHFFEGSFIEASFETALSAVVFLDDVSADDIADDPVGFRFFLPGGLPGRSFRNRILRKRIVRNSP